MVEKKYKVMAIKIEAADDSILMEDDYIPVGVVYASDGPYVSVLVPFTEPVKLADDTKMEDPPEEDAKDGQ